MSDKKLYLIDAYAMIYRAYYAFIRNPRRDSQGRDLSAVFGFTLSLQELLDKENPDMIAVVFDPPGGTFRDELYAEYKARRQETPEGIRLAVPLIKELLAAYRIPVVEVAHFEADDVIGTLATRADAEGYAVRMVTPDKDYAQLLSGRSRILRPSSKGGFELLGMEEMSERLGVRAPEQVVDLLGLMGDSSDNIPGCKGIGAKTAAKLLSDRQSIDDIYAHLDEIGGAVARKLSEGREMTYLSRKLALIRRDVPVVFDAAAFVRQAPDTDAMRSLFERLEFRNLLKRVVGIEETRQSPPAAASTCGDELFAFDDSSDTGGDLFAGADSAVNLRAALAAVRVSILTTPIAVAAYLACRQQGFGDTVLYVEPLYMGADALRGRLLGVAVSLFPEEAAYIPLPADPAAAHVLAAPLWRALEDPTVQKAGHNLKVLYQLLRPYGISLLGSPFDLMVARYVRSPEARNDLETLCLALPDERLYPLDAYVGRSAGIDVLTPEEQAAFAARRAMAGRKLYDVLSADFTSEEERRLFTEVEMPLVSGLAEMEEQGVRLDRSALQRLADLTGAEMAGIEQRIHELAGIEININSPKQVGELLFDRLELAPGGRKHKTKGGSYSTGEEVLQALVEDHPVVPLILRYRMLRKLIGTYIDPLPLCCHADGKLHTSYNQCVTATGRLSSSNPNLQNIPIRTPEGRGIREAFVPRDAEFCFLSADYSQIELRIMAHLSSDEGLIEAFRRNEDVHVATAAKIFGLNADEVDAGMRRKAKTANFGIIYGISAFGLAERLHIARGEAKEFIAEYFRHYPGVKAYIDRAVEEAKELGYVTTLLGRRRYLPDINSRNATVRGWAERNAVNAPIQGTAADIIKLAMNRIDASIRDRGLRSRMIMQVHDELNFDVHLSETDSMRELVRDGMENALPNLKVPLLAEIGVGPNWLEAH